jgi:hypothetical protein
MQWIGALHVEQVADLPVSIVETAAFTARAAGFLTDDEIAEAKMEISARPKAGVVIPGTGGIRKRRFASGGQGKRGSCRIIYFFYNRDLPIFLLSIYHKGQTSNLSKREAAAAKKLVAQLIEEYSPPPRRMRLVKG